MLRSPRSPSLSAAKGNRVNLSGLMFVSHSRLETATEAILVDLFMSLKVEIVAEATKKEVPKGLIFVMPSRLEIAPEAIRVDLSTRMITAEICEA